LLLKPIVILLLLISTGSTANDNIQLSAFGTIGLVVSDSERLAYRRDVSYHQGVLADELDILNHSLFGVQLDASLTADLDFVGQVVLRDVAKSEFKQYLTLSFLRYSPTANWQIRIGRTAPDIFLHSASRDIGVAYTWAVPPNEVYSILPFRTVDGVDVSYSIPFNEGIIRTKFFTGQADTVVSSIAGPVSLDVKDIYGLIVNYSGVDWSFQAQHTQATIASESEGNQQLIDAVAQLPEFIWPGAAAFSQHLIAKGKTPKYSSISAQGYLGRYLLSAELSYISSSDSELIPTIVSGYASLAYMMGAHTFYGVYSFTDTDPYMFTEPGVQQQLIPELITGVTVLNSFYTSSQQTQSLGWRWDISANISSSLQWNHSHIDDMGGTLWLNNSGDFSTDTINIVMFSVSFTL